MTLYPESKCTAARAVDLIETYGSERLWMNSACDWGVSIPLAVPYAALELRRRGHPPHPPTSAQKAADAPVLGYHASGYSCTGEQNP